MNIQAQKINLAKYIRAVINKEPELLQDPELKEGIEKVLSAFKQYFETSNYGEEYEAIKNDLKDNVANDQIIEAMIQNYRLKLRILEELQSEIKQEKNKENAKPKINI